MAKRFEYRVCQTQGGYITYINGMWQGNQALDTMNIDKLTQSCPAIWEYLNAAGREGWELVGVAPHATVGQGNESSQIVNLLFLKKEF